MGVDAVLFAEKANRYFYYDRDHNLCRWIDDPQYAIYESRLKDNNSLSGYQIAYMIEKNIEDILKNDPERGLGNNLALREFVKMYPNDTFFKRTDHDSPDYHDIAEQRLSVEVKWEELLPKFQDIWDLSKLLYD